METKKLSSFNKRQIAKITNAALILYKNKQITKYLCRLILEADYSDVRYVIKLNLLVEDLTRCKGYYRNDQRINACDNAVRQWLTDIYKEG